MSAFVSVLGMSALLGAGSFAVGVLPLSFTFSKMTLARLSTLGTGLLLGTALGIIIPEGVETINHANKDKDFPTQTVAFSLIGGFVFMLLVEQLLSGHSHTHHEHIILPSTESSPRTQKSLPLGGATDVMFDVELGGLEHPEGIVPEFIPIPRSSSSSQVNQIHDALGRSDDTKKRAYPLTLGLVIHALADGLALGSSALANNSAIPSGLSLVVFLALIVHKAPTALALATSLLTTGLPRPDCRKHIAVFSASTPIGALVSFGVLSLFGFTQNSDWAGTALLVSGGTFLYVATALQPGQGSSDPLTERMKVLFLSLGMLVPVGLTAIFGDVH